MNPQSSSTQYESVAKELYKKNLELVVSNQVMTVLQKLYQIVVGSYEQKEVSQKFIDVITSDLKFESGMVALMNHNLDQLQVVATTKFAFDQEIFKLINLPIESLVIPDNSYENLFLKAAQSKKMVTSLNVSDVYGTWIPKEHWNEAIGIAVNSKINAIFAYPILFGTEVIGVYSLFSQRKEGEFSSFEMRVLSEIGNVFALAINRVTLYQDLQNANKKLKELDKRKDEFLSVAAHELRAPMTAIKGYLSMISEGDAGEMTVSMKDFVGEALSGNDRLIRLVNNMLNISRIEEGRLTFEMGNVNLANVCSTVVNEYKIQAQDKKLALNYSQTENVSDLAYVDRDRIYEVVSNLISNAIKYTDQGSVNVKLFNTNPKTVRVEISDTGPGMNEADKAKLFQKFFRAESSEGKVMGTGLGLYISKLLVEKFGGVIGFESETGKGSIFWFELPIVLG